MKTKEIAAILDENITVEISETKWVGKAKTLVEDEKYAEKTVTRIYPDRFGKLVLFLE